MMMMMKPIHVDFEGIRISCPEHLLEGEDLELRNWILENCKEDLLSAMRPMKETEFSVYNKDRRLNLLDNIAQVQRQYLQTEGPRVVFDTLLNGLLELLQCEYGFIAQVKEEDDGRPYLHSLALTDISWNEETRKLYAENEEAGFKFYNMNTLFGACMKTGQPVLSNSPKTDPRSGGIQAGHPAMHSFLGIPLYDRGGVKMSGMVGLTNKPGGFTKEDIAYLEPFVVTSSNLIQAYNTIKENEELIHGLEEKVTARTAELETANQQLGETNKQMVQASRIQLEHFACMSHEIRTPLNCIVGLSSLLIDSNLEAFQEDAVQMISTSSELLQAVVNDVLDYSKLESGNVKAEIVKANLQETLDAVVHSIECKGRDRNVRVTTHYGASVPEFCETDCRRLQQILYNLLGNAIKFSEEGGVVEFCVDVVESITTSVDVQSTPTCPFKGCAIDLKPSFTSRPNGCPFQAKLRQRQLAAQPAPHQESESTYLLRFSVKDFGIGIAEEEYENIFKPFRQARRDTEQVFGGTGLGLAITSKLVSALGGTIAVKSEVGRWSEFTVELALQGSPANVKSLSTGLEKATILMVTDGSTGSAFLRELGIDVLQYDSCDGLKDIAESQGGLSGEKVYICLVQEDLYDAESFRRLKREAKTVLLTYGPKYAVKEAKGHYRSLKKILPAVLLQSMSSYMNRSTNVSQVTRSISNAGDELVGFKQLRILIVEDNIINQKVLHRMLTKIGLQHVDIVNDGKEAVEQSGRIYYDLIFMDMQMPVMGGLEACQLITQSRRNHYPKVVFVTANASDAFESQAITAGGSGFISKPFNLNRIQKFLESL